MGSLPSPPRATSPSPEYSTSNYRVFAPFCMRDQPTPNTLECFNPLDSTWTYVTSIPGIGENHVLKGFATISIGYSIYIIGGRLCRKERAHQSDEFVEVDEQVLSSVLRYKICTQEWSKCAPLSMPRYDFACTVWENKVYVAGGQSILACARGLSSAEVYDSSLDQWDSLPDMSTLRYKCVGVTWQGKIYVVGGFAGNQPVPFTTERSSAEVFDTITGKWDLMANMWQLDVPPNQIVAVSGRLFSSGDCLNAWKGHIEDYDGELNMWNIVDGSHRRSLSSPEEENWPWVQRLYLTMAPIGTCLYFLVGYRMVGELSRTVSMVHMFDTAATRDAWTSFEPMEENGEKVLCSHCCVVQLS